MKMLHITIHTAVPEASAKFYCDVLGFAVQEKFTGAMGKSIQFLENPESDVRIELIDDEAQLTTVPVCPWIPRRCVEKRMNRCRD